MLLPNLLFKNLYAKCFKFFRLQNVPESYLEPPQRPKIERFAKLMEKRYHYII